METKKKEILEQLNKYLRTDIIQITSQEQTPNGLNVWAVIDKEWNKDNQKFLSHYTKYDCFISPTNEWFCVAERPKELPNGKFLLLLWTNNEEEIKNEYVPVTYAGHPIWSPDKYKAWEELGKTLIKELNETNNS